jgi:hypothetical protein
MDFAHFVVQHVPEAKKVLEEIESSSEKPGDFFIHHKIISRKELMKLLSSYAEQECSTKKRKNY